jgi:hypothetical protein
MDILDSRRRIAACSFGRWPVLVCFKRKVPLSDCWWLVCSERKYHCLVVDKPSEQASDVQVLISCF